MGSDHLSDEVGINQDTSSTGRWTSQEEFWSIDKTLEVRILYVIRLLILSSEMYVDALVSILESADYNIAILL